MEVIWFRAVKRMIAISICIVFVSLISSAQEKQWKEMKLFPILLNNRIGFIDIAGKVVVQPQFLSAAFFSDGMAWVEIKDGERGYIDHTGRLVARFDSSSVRDFSDGLAAVGVKTAEMKYEEKFGYIDKTGRWVIFPQFVWAGRFSEGLAWVRVITPEGIIDSCIDKTGKKVINLSRFERPRGEFSEGLVAITRTYNAKGYPDPSCYLIDKTGRIVLRLEKGSHFASYAMFSEGLLRVQVGSLYGFIDKTGRWVIPPQFDSASNFSDGLAAVSVKGKDGFIDHTGKMVFEHRYGSNNVSHFSEGLAVISIYREERQEDNVIVSFRKQGFINKMGKIVIDPLLNDIEDTTGFSGGLAKVVPSDGSALFPEQHKWGYIDKTGNYIWTPTK